MTDILSQTASFEVKLFDANGKVLGVVKGEGAFFPEVEVEDIQPEVVEPEKDWQPKPDVEPEPESLSQHMKPAIEPKPGVIPATDRQIADIERLARKKHAPVKFAEGMAKIKANRPSFIAANEIIHKLESMPDFIDPEQAKP